MKIIRNKWIIFLLLILSITSITVLIIKNSKLQNNNLTFTELQIPQESDIVKFWILIPDEVGASQYYLEKEQISKWMESLKSNNFNTTKQNPLLACTIYIQTDSEIYIYYINSQKFGSKINIDNPKFNTYTITDQNGITFLY